MAGTFITDFLSPAGLRSLGVDCWAGNSMKHKEGKHKSLRDALANRAILALSEAKHPRLQWALGKVCREPEP